MSSQPVVIKVGILIFNKMELLDFAGPYEVFTSARTNDLPCFEVKTYADSTAPVHVYGGAQILPHKLLNNSDKLDLIIIPGGYGIDGLEQSETVIGWLDYHKEQGAKIASVCTGAFLLARLGYLNGLMATTHHADLEQFRQFEEIRVVKHLRFVDQGQIITSAGISAGIDMALHLVAQFCDEETAEQAALRMEWK